MNLRLLTKLTLSVVFFIVAMPTQLLAAGSFNQNNIIDDAIFSNTNSMTAAQINTFLNTFSGSCLSTNNGFSAPDPTGYSPSNGFTYGANVSAGQVIADAASAYGLSPQVLLATLEKEQSLVSGSAGCSTLRYAGALGYGCPDGGTSYSYSGLNLYTINGATVTSVSGTCVNSAAKAGFSQQVIHAAWLLKFGQERSEGNIGWDVQLTNAPQTGDSWDNSDDPQSCYNGPMTQGTWQRCPSGGSATYDGYTTIDSTSVHMDDGATAALYWYTPHFSGNQNFFNIFTNWFGDTHAPLYSWSIQSFTYTNGDNLLTTGVQEEATLKAVNTGNTPWYNYGNNVVRLGTWEPADSPSTLYSPGWLSPNRPAALTENQVLPGQVGTFTFPITLSTSGTYIQSLNLVVENSQWMVWPGFRPTIIGTSNPYQWQVQSVVYSNGTGVMVPGTTQLITLIAQNTGNVTWSKTNGPPIRLGTWLPGRESALETQGWLSPSRVVDMNETSVAPGQTAGFQFRIQAPAIQGLYYENFNLVAEGQAWFNNPGLALYIKSGAYAWQPVWTSISTGSTIINKGQSFTVTIRAKNTGDATWYGGASGSPPIHLGTAGPLNRGSNLYDPSWVSDIRPTGLIEASVPPGQEGTFSFQATAPQTAEAISEPFNLVAEGQQWFAGPNVTFNLTIK